MYMDLAGSQQDADYLLFFAKKKLMEERSEFFDVVGFHF